MKRHAALFVVLLIVMHGMFAVGGYLYFLSPNPSPAPAPTTPLPPAGPPADTEDSGEWNTYHGSNTLTGTGTGAFPDTLSLLWRFKAGAPVRLTPVVHQQKIYVVTARGDLIAINLRGESLWTKELLTGEEKNGEPVRERVDAPISVFKGLIFVGTTRGTVYAFDAASGDEKWRAALDGPILGSPNYLAAASGQEDRIFIIAQAQGELYCLNAASGKTLWKTEGVERCDGSPSVSPGAIVFGSCAAALHVYSPQTGQSLKNIAIDPDSQVAGGVALDGKFAVSGSRSGKILQADVTAGVILWSNTDCQGEAFATPAITSAWVIEAAEDGLVYALDRASGKKQWQFDTKGLPSSAVISSDKVFVSADGELFSLRLSDGVPLWSTKVSDEITSPALTQRLILVGSEDGTVAAFGPPQEQEGSAS